MNKSQLIDALKEKGITPPAGATVEMLRGFLDEANAGAGSAGDGAADSSDEGKPDNAASQDDPPPPSQETPPGPPADAPAPIVQDTPAPAPAAPPVIPPPVEDETWEFIVKGQPICEDGVTYKKGETILLTEARALAIGPELLEEADD